MEDLVLKQQAVKEQPPRGQFSINAMEKRLNGDRTRMMVAYGGGVNSTAMLIEMYRRGVIPDVTLFSDTGGERPETMLAVQRMSEWCVQRGMPEIITLRSPNTTLYDDCVARKSLPSLAYGYRSCSIRFKQEPQEKFLNNWQEKGEIIYRCIGFDYKEFHRIRVSENPNKWINAYPLVEWKINRDRCIEIVAEERIEAIKSSCFFCPAMKPREVIQLGEEHPELLDKALAMEERADLHTVKGLGRTWSWADLINNHGNQLTLECEGESDVPCLCWDGG